MLVGVDLIGQLALRAVSRFVLASAAKLVDDLLPVDLHLDTPFGGSRSLVQPARSSGTRSRGAGAQSWCSLRASSSATA